MKIRNRGGLPLPGTAYLPVPPRLSGIYGGPHPGLRPPRLFAEVF